MATATQAGRNGAQPQTTTKPASNASDEAAKKGEAIVAAMVEKTTTFTPFQASDPITLSVSMVLKHLCTPTKSGKLCSESMATKFIMMCKARKLNPWEGDAFIVGYDTKDGPVFSLITAHQAFLKRAEVHPEYDGMESGVTLVGPDGSLIDHPGDYAPPRHVLVAGWAKVHFRTRSIPTYRRLGLAQFNKGYGVWKNNPFGMIVKCAEADALRSSFPTQLGGMYLAEEMHNTDEMRAINATATAPSTGVAALADKLEARKVPHVVTVAPPVQVSADSIPDAPAVMQPDDESNDSEPTPEPTKPTKATKAHNPAVDGDPEPGSPEDAAAMADWAKNNDAHKQ